MYRVLLVNVFVVLLFMSACSDQSRHAPYGQDPITLRELYRRGVTGRIGSKLGQIIHIKGEVIDLDTGRKMDADVPYWLRIDSVDGKNLATPQHFRYNPHVLGSAPAALRVGDVFSFYAYESGGFSGVVTGEFDLIGPYAWPSYAFNTELIILSDEVSKVKDLGDFKIE